MDKNINNLIIVPHEKKKERSSNQELFFNEAYNSSNTNTLC